MVVSMLYLHRDFNTGVHHGQVFIFHDMYFNLAGPKWAQWAQWAQMGPMGPMGPNETKCVQWAQMDPNRANG